MKPLHLNLASRPFRDIRPLGTVVIATSAIILFLMANNARTAYRFFVNTEEIRAETAELEARTAEQRHKVRDLESQLAQLDTPVLQARTAYVNARIAERAFSWNELLDHLETVVPGDVRLVTLTPQVTETGPVNLTLLCIAKTDDGLVEMIRRMIADPHFDQPFPLSEARIEEDLSRFVLRVGYLPNPAAGEVSQ